MTAREARMLRVNDRVVMVTGRDRRVICSGVVAETFADRGGVIAMRWDDAPEVMDYRSGVGDMEIIYREGAPNAATPQD